MQSKGLPSARLEIRGWVLRLRGVLRRMASSAGSNFNSLKLNVSSCRGHCIE